MNQSLFLHIVERLEAFLGRMPASIQQPILREVTPLKELFLQQRPPRFVLTGSSKLPLRDVVTAIFAEAAQDSVDGARAAGIYEWQQVAIAHIGKASFLDARGADESALARVSDELAREPADLFFFLSDETSGQKPIPDVDNLETLVQRSGGSAKIVALDLAKAPARLANHSAESSAVVRPNPLSDRAALQSRLLRRDILRVGGESTPAQALSGDGRSLMSLLVQELPNEARVEMIRISRDRDAQLAISETLVKSTAAICTAVGAQPIPLADLPILTTLQLVMVSGIMYVSGRERSMRAATEFVAALGANVGAGMVLREGTRALLKFVPGWGNIVCGMVAGAGTYAMGRAATAYFVEGGSLKDARRVFRIRRKAAVAPALLQPGSRETTTENAPLS